MRRSFLASIERERVHPSGTYLHYNTWYDPGFRDRFNEAAALERIHASGIDGEFMDNAANDAIRARRIRFKA
jgi:hypothetical protein